MGSKDSGELGFAGSAAEAKNMGFMALNVDTMFWSVTCGILFVGSSDGIAGKVSISSPSKTQLFVELIVEMVSGSVKDAFHGNNKLICAAGFNYLCVDSPHESS